MFKKGAILILSTWLLINKMSFTSLLEMQVHSNLLSKRLKLLTYFQQMLTMK